jgi:hypothetical protein
MMGVGLVPNAGMKDCGALSNGERMVEAFVVFGLVFVACCVWGIHVMESRDERFQRDAYVLIRRP